MSEERGRKPVVEAVPLTADVLIPTEIRLIEEISAYVKELNKDAALSERKRDQIDSRRSNRIVFLNGGRGTGKTALFLTLLEAWESKRSSLVPLPDVLVSLPILDFDPLPEDLPLHAWLLLPWENAIKKFPEEDERDRLTEAWQSMFDLAIAGWTPATTQGGFTEQVLRYQDQTGGWYQLRNTFNEFVRSFFDLRAKHEKKPGNKVDAKHTIMVVGIDDVDLQVERVPQLLHAIRLLSHPQLLYFLNGDLRHLRQVLDLNCVNRHVGGNVDVLLEVMEEKTDYTRHVAQTSRQLAHALLDKAIPEGATFNIPLPSLRDLVGSELRGPKEEGSGETESIGLLAGRYGLNIRQDLLSDLRRIDDATRSLGWFNKVAPFRRVQRFLDQAKESDLVTTSDLLLRLLVHAAPGDDKTDQSRLWLERAGTLLAEPGAPEVIVGDVEFGYRAKFDYEAYDPENDDSDQIANLLALMLRPRGTGSDPTWVTASSLSWVTRGVLARRRAKSPSGASVVVSWPWALHPEPSELAVLCNWMKALLASLGSSEMSGDQIRPGGTEQLALLGEVWQSMQCCITRSLLEPNSAYATAVDTFASGLKSYSSKVKSELENSWEACIGYSRHPGDPGDQEKLYREWARAMTQLIYPQYGLSRDRRTKIADRLKGLSVPLDRKWEIDVEAQTLGDLRDALFDSYPEEQKRHEQADKWLSTKDEIVERVVTAKALEGAT